MKVYRAILIFLLLLSSCFFSETRPEEIYRQIEADLSAYQRQAERGNAEAAFNLYHYYSDVRKDDQQAVLYLELAAELQKPEAQFVYARHLLDQPDEPSQRKGLLFLFRSYHAGVKEAALVIAKGFREGLWGLPRDGDKAVEWEKLGAGRPAEGGENGS